MRRFSSFRFWTRFYSWRVGSTLTTRFFKWSTPLLTNFTLNTLAHFTLFNARLCDIFKSNTLFLGLFLFYIKGQVPRPVPFFFNTNLGTSCNFFRREWQNLTLLSELKLNYPRIDFFETSDNVLLEHHLNNCTGDQMFSHFRFLNIKLFCKFRRRSRRRGLYMYKLFLTVKRRFLKHKSTLRRPTRYVRLPNTPIYLTNLESKNKPLLYLWINRQFAKLSKLVLLRTHSRILKYLLLWKVRTKILSSAMWILFNLTSTNLLPTKLKIGSVKVSNTPKRPNLRKLKRTPGWLKPSYIRRKGSSAQQQNLALFKYRWISFFKVRPWRRRSRGPIPVFWRKQRVSFTTLSRRSLFATRLVFKLRFPILSKTLFIANNSTKYLSVEKSRRGLRAARNLYSWDFLFTNCIWKYHHYRLITAGGGVVFLRNWRDRILVNWSDRGNRFKYKPLYFKTPGVYFSSNINKYFEYFFNSRVATILNYELLKRLPLWDFFYLESVKSRLYLTNSQFSTIFFTNEFLDIVYLALKLKNFSHLITYLNRLLKSLIIWEHKRFLLFFFEAFKEQFFPIFPELSITGLQIIIKGKVGVGGDSRKRSIKLHLGQLTRTNSNLNTYVLKTWLNTKTGALGFNILIFYKNITTQGLLN